MSSRTLLPGYEKTVTCPYNKSHIILAHRFQTHLVKCKRANPNIQLEICPFDQTHHVPKEELNAHVTTCPGRAIFDLHIHNVHGNNREERPAVSAPPPPPRNNAPVVDDEDDWDNYNTTTYDPQKYVQNAKVLRSAGLSTKSERRKFRDEERQRLSQLERDN